MFIVTGAEGSGKTTVVNELSKIMDFYWVRYVSTSIEEGPGLQRINWDEYRKLAESDALEVSVQKKSAFFGVTHDEIKLALQSGKPVVWEVDLSLLENVRNDFPEARIILLNGIGIEDLYERFENKGHMVSAAIGMKASVLNSLNKSWHDEVDFVVDNRKDLSSEAAQKIKDIIEGKVR